MKKKAYATIMIFMLLTACPWLLWLIVGNRVSISNTENRNLSEFPVFSLTAISEYPGKLEEYLDDHFPFRDTLIEWNSAIDYYVLRSSSNDQVVLGKKGWLFYAGEDSTAFYKGRKQYSEKQLKKIAKNLQLTEERLREKGIKFILVLAPNRERMYPEYLPDYYGSLADPNALDQVTRYLREHTDIPVISAYEILMDRKKQDPEKILYHKTDTHWNDLAGFYIVQELLKQLEIPFTSDIVIEEIPDTPGDLADMLKLSNYLNPGVTYRLDGYKKTDTEPLEQDFFGHIHYISPSNTTGKIIVARDSFGSALEPFIREVFTESDMIHHRAFDNEIIDQEQPEYFVYEVVERSLNKLLKFQYQS